MNIGIDIPNHNENGQPCDKIIEQVFSDFLDLFFDETDYFMLVYPRKNLSENQILFKNELKPFEFKKRYTIDHPGTKYYYSGEPFLEMVFYHTDEKAKEILKKVKGLCSFKSPDYPYDIAFYKGNKCRFFSVAHEYIGSILFATQNDIDFLKNHNLFNAELADDMDADFNKFDELFLDLC